MSLTYEPFSKPGDSADVGADGEGGQAEGPELEAVQPPRHAGRGRGVPRVRPPPPLRFRAKRDLQSFKDFYLNAKTSIWS